MAPPLDLLYKYAAPNAILNSGGRVDEVRCYPGTREEVIGLVEKSIDVQDGSGPRILWLSGPAGAGKSAIMQTVAERCKQRGVPQANFFFFRADSSRSNIDRFVATIMHQIIQLCPPVGPAVANALASDPLIVRIGFPQQFDTLIHQTLDSIPHLSSTHQPLALLIDGLDECDSVHKTGQRQLLQALDTLIIQKGPRFRVVVASRVEPQISMTFKRLHSQVDTVFLDDQYSPENHIRLFVTAYFDSIESTHYLAHTLSPDWPSDADIDGLVAKSSGQFIYVATIMRFIAYSSASPLLSLQKVQGIVPLTKNTPFAQLDAVYSYILEQVDDWEAIKAILVIKFLDWDFLQDKTRAGEYYVDVEIFCATALPIWWVCEDNFAVFGLSEAALERVQQPAAAMTAALIEPHPFVSRMVSGSVKFSNPTRVETLIKFLHRLYAPHDPQAFTDIMRTWTSYSDGYEEYCRQFDTVSNDSKMLRVVSRQSSIPTRRRRD